MAITATPRQMDALRFIAGYRQAKGRGPGFREIAAALGLSGPGRAHRIVSGLEERGLVLAGNGRPGAIDVLVDVAVPCAPDGAPLYFVEVR